MPPTPPTSDLGWSSFGEEGNLFQVFVSAVNQGEKEKQVSTLQAPGQQKEKGSQKQPSP